MRTMRMLAAVMLLCLAFASLCSCVSSRVSSLSSFSLEAGSTTANASRIITGSVAYGAGFYFPTSTDILDISLLKTDGTTGTVLEISHQRIRNIQRFPVQFTVRYDGEDVREGDSCMVMVSLSTDGKTTAQGFGNLVVDSGSSSGFKDVSIVLYAVEE